MSFFQELKRRNVVRAGIAYVIVAWLLLQVADLVLENINAPDWVMQTFMLAVAIGFPLVLIFAWAFELTPEGIKREKDIDRDTSITPQTGRKLDRAIIVVLALAVVFLLYQQFRPEAPPAGDARPGATEPAAPDTSASSREAPDEEKSIAVLPFRDMSAARDQAYFGEGIAEELLNALVKLDGIKVASRTSAFSLAGENLDIPTIARRLGVNHVLEGSVRTSGNQVRVTAQLIDVAEDVHLWSETYDGSLDDIFRIQDEITGKITEAMKVQFGEQPRVSSAEQLTSNAEAYQLYLQGRHLWRQRDPEALHRSVDLFKRAVELDPEFHQAWSNLGIAYLNLPDYDRSYDIDLSFEQGLAAADRALEINPHSTEARLIKANYAEHQCDTVSATEQYLAAIEDNPDDPTARHWFAIQMISVGKIGQAREHVGKAMAIDPLISAVVGINAVTMGLEGKTDEALEMARQANALGFRGGASEFEGQILLMAGDRAGGAAEYRKVARLEGDPRREQTLRAFADALEDPDAYTAFIRHVGTSADAIGFEAPEISDLLALLGSDYLFEYYRGDECPLVGQMTWSPTFRGLRGTPEFFELMQRTGIVDYWREHGWPDDCASLDQSLAECPE